MKTQHNKRRSKLILELISYGSYVDETRQLETILARKPARLQIEFVGSGEMPSDMALLMRSMILKRSTRTHLITNARSSLQGAVVLVWLLGDSRLIRDDARLYFRAAGPFKTDADGREVWNDRRLFEDVLDAADYVRVLERINEFLPVRELAGRPIELLELKQFGLVDNEKMDTFLATAFRKGKSPEGKRRPTDKGKVPKEASR
jgi:hypothetical protein